MKSALNIVSLSRMLLKQERILKVGCTW